MDVKAGQREQSTNVASRSKRKRPISEHSGALALTEKNKIFWKKKIGLKKKNDQNVGNFETAQETSKIAALDPIPKSLWLSARALISVVFSTPRTQMDFSPRGLWSSHQENRTPRRLRLLLASEAKIWPL